MCAISVHGLELHHPVLSIGSHQTGRKNTFSVIWPMLAASFKPTVTKAMPSFTSLNRVVCRVCAKRLVGPTCGALAIVLGPMAENGSLHDFWTSTKSELAREALDRIGKFYDIERDLNGQSADVRHATRQKLTQHKVTAFFAWSEQQLLRIPGKSDLAKAFRYGLARQEAFSLFLSDGRVAIDNNPAERALRPIGIGRKNWLFAGADTGAETLARAMTVIETAKLNGLDPLAYLADILDRIHDHKINRLDELLPWNWSPVASAMSNQAA
jgi:hypothetical protein